MRKLKWEDAYAAAFLLAWLPILYAYNRATTNELSISLEDCQPRDVWAKISRAYGPRHFWIAQNVKLEMTFQADVLRRHLEDCDSMYPAGDPSTQECISHYRTRWYQAQQCVEHSAKLCRIEGGRC